MAAIYEDTGNPGDMSYDAAEQAADNWGENEPYPCELCGVQGTQHEFVKAYVPGYGNVVGHPACVYAHGAETTK